MINPELIKARDDIAITKTALKIKPGIVSLFKECTPKILVVTDSLSFTTAQFGLSDFVNTLRTSTIHGMTPIVETALHKTGGTADHPNFSFTSTSLSKSKYDVLFLFGSSGPSLNATEIGVIEDFMDAGGGVFATGDHSTLGKPLCGGIKRVKEMRRWNGPSATTKQRLSTNDPGTDNSFAFTDQSDSIPQKIYPAYKAGVPHALLQHPTKNIIEVLPDHPHESECWVPSSLSASDWPKDDNNQQVEPELVALSVSYGGGFSTKADIEVPRCFGAIGAYDGHETEDCVGRIVVDATWHHFINVNLITNVVGPNLSGNADAYDRVNTYFRNIANWLMPKKVRLCLRWAILMTLKEYYPIGEFLMERANDDLKLADYLELGHEMRSSLSGFLSRSEIVELEDDLIEVANPRLTAGLRKIRELNASDETTIKDTQTENLYRLASAGVAVQSVAELLADNSNESIDANFKKIDGEKGLETNFKKKVEPCFKALNKELLRGRKAVDELIDVLK